MSTRPNAEHYRDDVEYFREICERTGLSTRQLAKAIGINDGELRGYLSGRRTWPYVVQYAIEQLDDAPVPRELSPAELSVVAALVRKLGGRVQLSRYEIADMRPGERVNLTEFAATGDYVVWLGGGED